MIREFVKKMFNSAFAGNILGAKFLCDRVFREATVILLYHEVSDNPSALNKKHHLNVSPRIFEDQITAIKRIFNIITPDQLLSGNYKRPACLVTFDDGFAGSFENAFPILKKHGVPSIIFLNMGPVLGEVFWSGLAAYVCETDSDFVEYLKKRKPDIRKPYFLFTLPDDISSYYGPNEMERIYSEARNYYGEFASKKHLEESGKNPLVSYGNHLYNHFNCVAFGEKDIREAYEKNQAEISKYHCATDYFSFPYGQEYLCYNKKTVNMIKDLGAQAIFTADFKTFYPSGSVFSRLPVMTETVRTEREFRAFLITARFKQILRVVGLY